MVTGVGITDITCVVITAIFSLELYLRLSGWLESNIIIVW